MKQREKVVPLATGRVLEIGIGSGLNLPFYNNQNVKQLTALDPYEALWQENNIAIDDLGFDFQFIKASSENIPEDNNTFDSAVITYTLCSIDDVKKALHEIKRVLKPNGMLIFCEHGKAPDKSVERVQQLITPIWKRLGGGCNLQKDIPKIITNNGFKINDLKTMYIPGWKPISYNFWGTARPN
ncbi:class I SAM-dependent methyltransferase [Aestuariivivens insulae]|uniref:class I SAM-dependent methyltransferase n=1 Tax=Aestuariivivens insulae TaxID=1621988 RepID=UPI001F56F3B9|nr:class I SAM-dependent methyltransferase [Aestuariivivens insulae]